MKNKVISREYVEKNYISKEDLKKFIENKMQIIKKRIDKNNIIAMQYQLDGMKAVYKAIQDELIGG